MCNTFLGILNPLYIEYTYRYLAKYIHCMANWFDVQYWEVKVDTTIHNSHQQNYRPFSFWSLLSQCIPDDMIPTSKTYQKYFLVISHLCRFLKYEQAVEKIKSKFVKYSLNSSCFNGKDFFFALIVCLGIIYELNLMVTWTVSSSVLWLPICVFREGDSYSLDTIS